MASVTVDELLLPESPTVTPGSPTSPAVTCPLIVQPSASVAVNKRTAWDTVTVWETAPPSDQLTKAYSFPSVPACGDATETVWVEPTFQST